MKYSENLVKATIKALENHPFYTVWNIHRHAQYDGFCEIRFENIDKKEMSITIGESEINAIAYSDESHNGYKWFGTCCMSQNTKDSYMVWLGIVVTRMLDFFD